MLYIGCFPVDLLIILNEVTNQLSQKESIKDCIREKFSAYQIKMREKGKEQHGKT